MDNKFSKKFTDKSQTTNDFVKTAKLQLICIEVIK